LAFVASDDYTNVDEGKTRAIFGHPTGGLPIPKPRGRQLPADHFEPLGHSIGIFEYRGRFYVDTFFSGDGWADFEGKRTTFATLPDHLAVLLSPPSCSHETKGENSDERMCGLPARANFLEYWLRGWSADRDGDWLLNLFSQPEMPAAEFRFYEELNDYLHASRRKRSFTHTFAGAPAIKDIIEALGVPHTEIDLILVDGRSVRFSHRLRGGERVAVYPMFERFDIQPLHKLRPKPLRRTRFVADVHLGRLARYLRLLGFDTLYSTKLDDRSLVAISVRERRILLTRDASRGPGVR
jgi:hypothetical protein